jgi:hypothetical protein
MEWWRSGEMFDSFEDYWIKVRGSEGSTSDLEIQLLLIGYCCMISYLIFVKCVNLENTPRIFVHEILVHSANNSPGLKLNFKDIIIVKHRKFHVT